MEVLTFTITGDPRERVWSEHQQGLRVAQQFLPSGPRYFLGETIQRVFLIENVSSAPITFYRTLRWAQGDDVFIRTEVGGPLGLGKSFSTGGHPLIRWTLSPGMRVKVYAGRLSFDDRFSVGRYFIRHRVSLWDWKGPEGVHDQTRAPPGSWTGNRSTVRERGVSERNLQRK